jgi:aspartyl protease family protein
LASRAAAALMLAMMLALVLGAHSGPAAAQSVSLAGSMGSDKALLMIDGQPRTLAVGASSQGVTLRRLGDGQAEVELAGRRLTLTLGAAPARVDGAGRGAPVADTDIVLPMGPGGHFSGSGATPVRPPSR